MKKLAFCALSAVTLIMGLGGCARMSLVDAYKLNKVEFSTTSVKRLRVAVHIPKYFRLRKPGAVITMTLKKNGSKPAQSERFVLQEIPASQELKKLVLEEGAGGNYYAFRIRPDDIARFEHIRNQSRENAPGSKRSGSMNVTASVCRTKTRLPKKIPFSAFLKAQETGDYVALARDVDLMAEIGFKDAIKLFPSCGNK